MVQGGVASSSESGVTGLTAKRLDPFSKTMLTIPNQGMNVSVCDAGVGALSVRTGEALCVYPLRCSRQLFTSHQGRTAGGAGSTTDERVQERRQAGQSCGERGLRRRWIGVRLAAAD